MAPIALTPKQVRSLSRIIDEGERGIIEQLPDGLIKVEIEGANDTTPDFSIRPDGFIYTINHH